MCSRQAVEVNDEAGKDPASRMQLESFFAAAVDLIDNKGACLDSDLVKERLIGADGPDQMLWHRIVQIEAASQAISGIVRAVPELVYARDDQRRTAYVMAIESIRKMIDTVVEFCGRFRITSTRPEHKSATCVILRATFVSGWLSSYSLIMDTRKPLGALPKRTAGVASLGELDAIIGKIDPTGQAAGVGWQPGFRIVEVNGTPVKYWGEVLATIQKAGNAKCVVRVDPNEERDVVVKLMKNRDQYDREIAQREQLSASLCVPVVFKSGDDPEAWKQGAAERALAEYPFGIVMPAAARNLMVILVQERVDFTTIRKMLYDVGTCLGHMHECAKVHGDVKPLNVVRSAEGNYMLIDFDATVDIGQPVGAKTSTAYVPPEFTFTREDQSIAVRTYDVDNDGEVIHRSDASNELLAAHPTFDIWSFAIIMYRAFCHDSLFKSDDLDNCSYTELQRLNEWSGVGVERMATSVQQAMCMSIENGEQLDPDNVLAACDLLAWMLQPAAENRPQSFNDILGECRHPLNVLSLQLTEVGTRGPWPCFVLFFYSGKKSGRVVAWWRW